MKFITIFAFLFLFASNVFAELQPSQVGIIANADSKNSRVMASYYARERQVPKGNILVLKMPMTETISYEVWSTRIRPQIRKWLRDKKLTGKLHCFVTMVDVPLKIEKAKSDISTARLKLFLQREKAARINRLDSILTKFHGAGTPAPKDPYVPIDPNDLVKDIQAKVQGVVETAQKRAQAMSDEEKRAETLKDIQKLFIQCVGIGTYANSLSRQISVSGASNSGLKSQFDFARGRLASIQEALIAIEMMPPSVERSQATLALVESSGGVMGSLAWLDSEMDIVDQGETHSSFDSELALVGWTGYSLNRWQPNYRNVRHRNSAINAVKKSYMVARIDGPSLKVARRIVDDAIAAEKDGLKGKAYFDGRGLGKVGDKVDPSNHEKDYDRSIAQIADWLKNYSNLEVVYNDKSELFQPGDCPDAAIYCGWYSLGNYVDAFDWKPGAVGFHIAQSEASTFDKDSNVWCKRMLDDGIAATLGPVYEPYTYAFPRPEQFFLLLLSGKYTLAECFALTNPYNSWTMTLIGDPLYNPFKNAPALDMEALPEELQDFINGT